MRQYCISFSEILVTLFTIQFKIIIYINCLLVVCCQFDMNITLWNLFPSLHKLFDLRPSNFIIHWNIEPICLCNRLCRYYCIPWNIFKPLLCFLSDDFDLFNALNSELNSTNLNISESMITWLESTIHRVERVYIHMNTSTNESSSSTGSSSDSEALKMEFLQKPSNICFLRVLYVDSMQFPCFFVC